MEATETDRKNTAVSFLMDDLRAARQALIHARYSVGVCLEREVTSLPRLNSEWTALSEEFARTLREIGRLPIPSPSPTSAPKSSSP